MPQNPPLESWPRLTESKHSETQAGSRRLRRGSFFRCPEDEEWYYAEPDARANDIRAALHGARACLTVAKQHRDRVPDAWQQGADCLCETLEHAEGYFKPMATKLDHFMRQAGEMQAADESCCTLILP